MRLTERQESSSPALFFHCEGSWLLNGAEFLDWVQELPAVSSERVEILKVVMGELLDKGFLWYPNWLQEEPFTILAERLRGLSWI